MPAVSGCEGRESTCLLYLVVRGGLVSAIPVPGSEGRGYEVPGVKGGQVLLLCLAPMGVNVLQTIPVLNQC